MQIPVQTELKTDSSLQMRLYDPQGHQLPQSNNLCTRAGATLELTPEEGASETVPRLKRYASHTTLTYFGDGAKRLSTILTTIVDAASGEIRCHNWCSKYEHSHTLEQMLRRVEDGEPIDDDGTEEAYRRDSESYRRKLPRTVYYERRLYDTGHVVERSLTQRISMGVTVNGHELHKWQ